MPDVLTPAQRQFTLNAGLTKAYTRKAVVNGVETEQMVLSGIASSTARDRHGDTITALGQASMLAKLQTGNNGAPLAMFLNHSYNVPEDVLGHCGESQLIADSASGMISLEIVCVVTPENPRAVMAWKIVKSGVTLGYSIGGVVTECSVDEENDDGESWCPPLLIDGIDLFEISLCGIPANPASYTDTAKSLVKELGLPENAPEPTTDWARAMRLGFVRSATRNPDVRRHLRRALPALHESATVLLTCTECDWKRTATAKTADAIVREHEDDQAHEVARSEAVAVTKDDNSEEHLDPEDQASIAACIGHLTAAMTHGGCSPMMESVAAAHGILTKMLAPDSDNVDDQPSNAEGDDVGATTNAASAPLTMTIGVTADTSSATAEVAKLAAAVEALRGDTERLTSELAKRATEIADLDAKRAALVAEIATLEKTSAEIKSEPAGRKTQANAPTGRTTSATLHDAQRTLGRALVEGATPGNPAQRPA